jgi:hypothetical protein
MLPGHRNGSSWPESSGLFFTAASFAGHPAA